ncbi:MAG: sulfatase-like hydrolase/transferase [Verrucomicrobiaceae bacterium]
MNLCSRLTLLPLLWLPAGGATYYWTGGGDGASVYAEANWTANSDGSGGTIPVISANTAVNHDLVVESGNPGGGGGASASLDLGSGSLSVGAGTFRMNVTSQSGGIRNGSIAVSGGRIIAEFVADTAVVLSGGTLELDSGGDPVDGATIDFTTGSSAAIEFSNEAVADVVGEHLAKITVGGAAAVESGPGQNVVITANGVGSIVVLGTMNPADSDDDQDGLSNGMEATLETNPALRDTDGDGTPDGLEVEKGLDPLDNTDGLDRPNIILFFVDDLGYGDLGCFWQDSLSGTQRFDTPGIDTMAAEGAKMTHHYISAPVCAPSRASLLQGRHQGHADVRDSQFDRALPNNHGMAETLRRAGYRTIHTGKNGLAGGEGSTNLTGDGSQNLGAHPLARGFDEFFGYLFHGDGHEHYPRNGTSDKSAHIYHGYEQVKNASEDLYTTDAWTAYAKKAITEEVNDGDGQPFFLYVAYETPHFKMQRPAVAYPSGGGLTGGIQWTTATDGAGNVRFASTATGTGGIDDYNHPGNHSSWPEAQKQHVGMIRRIDNSVADIIQLLKDLNIDDNTLCVFSSDNGPHNEGNNPRYFESFANLEGIKRDMLEGGIRVPTVVRWPGMIAGTTNDENDIHEIDYPSAISDWMPTFADLAEVPAPSWCDGVSLVPTLTGVGSQRDKGYLYFEFNTSGTTPNWVEFPNHRGEAKGQMQCVRIGDYMGIRRSIGSADDNFEIYDAVMDPGQQLNVANSLPDLQTQMKEIAITGRRPGTVSRPYDSEPLPAIITATEPGIMVSSYEGIWTYVPEFRDMTAASSGTATGFDLSKRSRDENVGLLFEGLLEVPTTGSYTFFVESDAGANLFLHDAHVIDDDFNHTGVEQSGAVILEAGAHPIRVYYRHGVGSGHELNVRWSGPGIAKELIPNAALGLEVPAPPEPSALDDTASTAGEMVEIAVLDNDLDDGAPMTLSIDSVGVPANGTAVKVGNAIRYTPNGGFYGSDRFRYTVTDGQYFATATVTISVTYQGADLWIPLDECGGNEVREAGGTLLGGMTGFADPDSSWVTGAQGNALSFDGDDDQVTLSGVPAANLPDGSTPRTIMAWIRTAAAQENQTIFGYGQNSNGQRFSFRTNGSGGNPTNQPLRLEVQGGAIVGATNLNDGQWHHVAVVCDDFDSSGTMDVNESKLYVDGVLDGIASASSRAIDTASGTTAVLGGSNHSANYSFAGDIDDLRLFPEALSQSEIQEIMNRTRQVAAAWHRENFGPAAENWDLDGDGDGLSRLGEFAFGGNPHFSDASQVREAQFNPATLKLEASFLRRKGSNHDLTYSIEASRDLLDWTSLTVTETGVVAHVSEACLEWAGVEADATSTEEAIQFVRAKADFTP